MKKLKPSPLFPPLPPHNNESEFTNYAIPLAFTIPRIADQYVEHKR